MKAFFPSFFFIFLESILFISWYKSLHCGALSNMNLSFLSRGRAFQPCEKGPHCGGPKTPEFLPASKRDLWGKKRICRPDFQPGVSHWLDLPSAAAKRGKPLLCNHILKTQGQNKREDFAFLSPFFCLYSMFAEQTAQLYYYILLLRLRWLSLHSITKVAPFGWSGPKWRSWFSALVTSDSLLEPSNLKFNQSSPCEAPSTTLENLFIKCRRDLPYTSNLSLHEKAKVGRRWMLSPLQQCSLYLNPWISIMRQRCRTRKGSILCSALILEISPTQHLSSLYVEWMLEGQEMAMRHRTLSLNEEEMPQISVPGFLSSEVDCLAPESNFSIWLRLKKCRISLLHFSQLHFYDEIILLEEDRALKMHIQHFTRLWDTGQGALTAKPSLSGTRERWLSTGWELQSTGAMS